MSQNDTEPQVWVGCLAAYNGGRLHGEWVPAVDADDLRESIRRILASSPEPRADEWMFSDFANFGALSLWEYESPEMVASWGAALVKYGSELAGYAGNFGTLPDSPEECAQEMEETRQGAHDSAGDLVYSIWDESGDLARFEKEFPGAVLDWARMGRDLEHEGYYEIDGEWYRPC
ncbi:ArdA Antirestriction protein [uncultured Caudovirales phage]|uniref:ArdA Antirestriction protein n=1 Tax=uncultured Caudovirales phage TaxID=2100421 RepID=A0A6J5PJS9_9CAUD|nr:ArdA Antirestriction protein [uncultured Caudovirales phage]CAB4187357.1 ArdA Antirestriction protein [uncultured Caudovirales phage]CAB4199696.1 ArdA Antirestriction protein [uncultured Caudovirales phage]